MLLITGAILDMLCDPELQAALQRLLHPPHKVVALLCGVSEDDVATECFEDWSSWRKLYAEDEPALYVSTVLESISDSTQNLNTLNYIHNYFFLVFYLTCSAISQSRLFWCELPGGGDLIHSDVCLLLYIIELQLQSILFYLYPITPELYHRVKRSFHLLMDEMPVLVRAQDVNIDGLHQGELAESVSYKLISASYQCWSLSSVRVSFCVW